MKPEKKVLVEKFCLKSGNFTTMSRIGKRPITIPAGIEVSADETRLVVKGKHATLEKAIHPFVSVSVAEGVVTVAPVNDTLLARALWGTFASHVKNMIHGVATPFQKKLVLDGVGYRMALAGNELTMSLGFSHPVKMTVPEGVTAVVEKNELTLTGSDKEVLGQFAANVRAKKKPEPYKGKGFHYSDEVILRKQGKKAS
jgi:large subunit ribosomal protein L6